MAANYGMATDAEKIRANAAILYMLKNNDPAGIIEAFKSGLDKASNVITTHGKSAERDESKIDKRVVKFQSMLDEWRDVLVASPKDLPDVKGSKEDLTHQKNALRAIQKAMAEYTDGGEKYINEAKKAVAKAVTAEKATIAEKPLGGDSPAKIATVGFIAKHSANSAGITMDNQGCTSVEPYLRMHNPNKGCSVGKS